MDHWMPCVIYSMQDLTLFSIVKPQKATVKDLMKFHSKNYIQCLQKADKITSEDEDSESEECMVEHGIGNRYFVVLKIMYKKYKHLGNYVFL